MIRFDISFTIPSVIISYPYERLDEYSGSKILNESDYQYLRNVENKFEQLDNQLNPQESDNDIDWL